MRGHDEGEDTGMSLFELRTPVDRIFEEYVDCSFAISGYPTAPEVEVGERCARKTCLVGTKTKSSKGEDVCANCGKPWRGRVSAFFDGKVGARPAVAEARFIAKLEPWSERKKLVEPLPAGFDRWFWGLCLTTMFAYVDKGIGTVDNVVRWGRVYQAHVRWSAPLVRDSITIARNEVSARQHGRVAHSDCWFGPVEGARLMGLPDPEGSGRRQALRMLRSGAVPKVENRSAGKARNRLMAPRSAWLSCV